MVLSRNFIEYTFITKKKKDKRKRGKNGEVVSNKYSERINHTIQKYSIDRFHESSYLFLFSNNSKQYFLESFVRFHVSLKSI